MSTKKNEPKKETGLAKRNPSQPKRIKVNTMINYQFTVEELAGSANTLDGSWRTCQLPI